MFEVFFSPHGGCESQIVKSIDLSKFSIFVLSYTFTNQPIATALCRAKARGVDVQFIGDATASKGRGCAIKKLHDSGIPCLIDSIHAIAHNKIIIIDNLVVLGGSFNHSKAAETSNGENLTRVTSAQVAGVYKANWDLHKSHSYPYNPLVVAMDPDPITPLSQE